jgi:hypothetical protein
LKYVTILQSGMERVSYLIFYRISMQIYNPVGGVRAWADGVAGAGGRRRAGADGRRGHGRRGRGRLRGCGRGAHPFPAADQSTPVARDRAAGRFQASRPSLILVLSIAMLESVLLIPSFPMGIQRAR